MREKERNKERESACVRVKVSKSEKNESEREKQRESARESEQEGFWRQRKNWRTGRKGGIQERTDEDPYGFWESKSMGHSRRTERLRSCSSCLSPPLSPRPLL